MSLGVKLFSKRDNQTRNKILNFNKDEMLFGILLDTRISDIKDKLFLYHPSQYNPKFTKLEFLDNSTYISIKGNNPLLYYTSQTELYADNVFNVINDYLSENNISLFEFYDLYKLDNLNDFYNKLSVDYVDMSYDDFGLAIKIMSKSLNEISSDEKEINNIDISSFENSNKQLFDNIFNKSKETRYSTDYFNNVYKTDIFPIEKDTFYTNVDIYINNLMGRRVLNTEQIFNSLKLSSFIPFSAYSKRDKIPRVKIYDNITEDIDNPEIIKEWILNEKKKDNLKSYKKIKSLVLKCKYSDDLYATVNINEKGIFKMRLKNDDETSIERIKEFAIEIYIKLVNIFNTMLTIKLDTTYEMNIDSINTVNTTTVNLNHNKMRSMFSKSYINDRYSIKDTKEVSNKMMEYISIYYTNLKSESEEKKGITINIKHNQEDLDSSIINLYGCDSVAQSEFIAKDLYLMFMTSQNDTSNFSLFDDSDDNERVLADKSNAKKLKKSGFMDIDPKKCPTERQLKISDGNDTTVDTIKLDGKLYTCNEKYPHTGFNDDRSLCCFKNKHNNYEKDQDNAELVDTLVQPSNLEIEVNGIKTFVIKKLYIDNESPYYYIDLNKEDVLVHIHNSELQQKIKEKELEALNSEKILWLKETSLFQLINTANNSSCKNHPANFDDKSICSNDSTHKFFGYTKDSFPCCFEKANNDIIKPQKKTINKNIIKKDIFLNKDQLGVLPEGLKTLFNNFESEFVRLGVIQNDFSFMYCIATATSDLKTLFSLKNYLISNITDNIYRKLNNGNISIKYENLETYKKAILENKVNYKDLIDLIQQLLRCNILILEIPYDKKTKKYNYEGTNIMCNFDIKYNNNNPYLVLLKKNKSFELIVEKKEDSLSVKLNPENKAIEFLTDYMSSSCVKKDVFPDNWSNDSLHTGTFVVSKLKDTSNEIFLQIVNDFNKTEFLVTKKGLIIPIIETGILSKLPIAKLNELIIKDKLITFEKAKEIINEIKEFININIRGVIVKNEKMIAIMTSYNVMIPIKQEKFEESNDIQVVNNVIYYGDLNSVLNKYENFTPENKTQLKKKIGAAFQQNNLAKKNILDIITSRDTIYTKINKALEIIKNLDKENNKENNKDLQQELEQEYYKIAIEIVNDNIDNKLINNIIVEDVPNELKVYQGETLWLNILDITKWVEKKSNN